MHNWNENSMCLRSMQKQTCLYHYIISMASLRRHSLLSSCFLSVLSTYTSMGFWKCLSATIEFRFRICRSLMPATQRYQSLAAHCIPSKNIVYVQHVSHLLAPSDMCIVWWNKKRMNVNERQAERERENEKDKEVDALGALTIFTFIETRLNNL